MIKLNGGQLWIGLLCVVLGIVLSLQFKIVQKNYLEGLNPNVVSSQLISELSQTRGDKAKLKQQLESLQGKIDAIEEAAAKDNAIVKNLKEEIREYKTMAGLVDVYGPGVEVVIDNPSKELNYNSENNIVTEFDMVLRLVNELNASGAEAIVINDQRLVSTSEVRTAGKNLIVNTVPVTAPLVIKAIGEGDTLDGTLNQRFGIVSEIREAGYLIEVKRSERVEIPKYNGIIQFNFAETIEE